MVIGAGASREFGLPTGAELLERIAQLADIGPNGRESFRGNYSLYETFQFHNHREQNGDSRAKEQLHSCRFIRDNMPLAPSIDNFLHTHQNDAALVHTGKVLIAKAILDSERQSTLLAAPKESAARINFGVGIRNTRREDSQWEWKVAPPSASWLGELFKIMVSGRNYPEFKASVEAISFVSFNYDRCIEQFFAFAAKSYFSIDDSEVRRLLRSLKVIHPYGSLGELRFDARGVSNFGEDIYNERLLDVAQGIRTFTEGVADERLLDEIHNAFSEADNVVFLGFGFIPLNLSLLFQRSPYDVKRVLGTSKGLSEESAQTVSRSLKSSLYYRGHPARDALLKDGDRQAELSSVTCSELFRRHWLYFLGTELVT
jgi:hypothetical protein